MGRKARIDTPGAVHHVVTRGLERGRIFAHAADYQDFLVRLGKNLNESGATCLAWSLMPNHIHLVLRTGQLPLSRIMHRLLLGYCAAYNSKRGRTGHLFEGRYKSILCEEEPYLLELVRYVHLNPVRAGLCASVAALARYAWSGHRCLMGHGELAWQEVDSVLGRFGGGTAEARRRYVKFLEDGLAGGPGRGAGKESLRRLVEGGWETVKGVLQPEGRGADESIMGSERFIARVLREAQERERWKSALRGKMKPAEVVARAAREAGIPVAQLKGAGKIPAQCRGRGLACYWLVDVLGLTEVAVARLLGITQSAVSINVRKGQRLAKEEGLKLLGRE